MIVGARLLRPIDELRAATRRMAAGDFATPVPVPAETELASLANDVNDLGEHLATIERRRTQLLGEVTHEMRTPITVIRGQAEGLIDGVITPSAEVFAGSPTRRRACSASWMTSPCCRVPTRAHSRSI